MECLYKAIAFIVIMIEIMVILAVLGTEVNSLLFLLIVVPAFFVATTLHFILSGEWRTYHAKRKLM